MRLGPGCLPPLVTGYGFPVWARGHLQTPDVLGDVHRIFSCNSIDKDPCGLTVGGSRNTRKVDVAGPGEASRTLFLFLNYL